MPHLDRNSGDRRGTDIRVRSHDIGGLLTRQVAVSEMLHVYEVRRALELEAVRLAASAAPTTTSGVCVRPSTCGTRPVARGRRRIRRRRSRLPRRGRRRSPQSGPRRTVRRISEPLRATYDFTEGVHEPELGAGHHRNVVDGIEQGDESLATRGNCVISTCSSPGARTPGRCRAFGALGVEISRSAFRSRKVFSAWQSIVSVTWFPTFTRRLRAPRRGRRRCGDHRCRRSIWPSAVLRADYGAISVGARTSVQDGTVLHTSAQWPTVIGAGCVVGHNAHLEGAVVEDGCLIGSMSTCLQRVVVGTGSLVGAAALLTEGTVVPPRSRVLGAPATRCAASGSDGFAEGIERGVATYVAERGALSVGDGAHRLTGAVVAVVGGGVGCRRSCRTLPACGRGISRKEEVGLAMSSQPPSTS